MTAPDELDQRLRSLIEILLGRAVRPVEDVRTLADVMTEPGGIERAVDWCIELLQRSTVGPELRERGLQVLNDVRRPDAQREALGCELQKLARDLVGAGD